MQFRRSIASRWFMNSFLVVAVIVLVLIVGVYAVARQYYYSAVSQYLFSEANTIAGVLTYFYDESASNYAEEVRTAVESFDKKNIMELMAIDKDGNVDISSSGFSPEDEAEMPDYISALNSADGTGQYVGYLDRSSSGEKYMAVSVTIVAKNSDYSAIRMMTGLEKVDEYIGRLVLIAALSGLVVLFFVLAIGLYFVRSILSPIKEINASAKQLAKGNFTRKIPVKGSDEISELCATFNSMAEALADSETIKNDFISSVSHELRTPLTAIKGWSETILQMKDRETLIKGMRVITEETERLSAMVEDLLDFSRIQNDRLTLQKSNMDVIAELGDAVLVYTETAKKNNIIINYREPEGAVMVYGDKNRLRQVFVNVIDNAVKYTGKDGVINVDVFVGADSVEIKISDDGCGISKDDLPKVKNRFFKANNTVRGSGIGLAVADELVSRHGGALEIESELGAGTTVTIELPTI